MGKNELKLVFIVTPWHFKQMFCGKIVGKNFPEEKNLSRRRKNLPRRKKTFEVEKFSRKIFCAAARAVAQKIFREKFSAEKDFFPPRKIFSNAEKDFFQRENFPNHFTKIA